MLKKFAEKEKLKDHLLYMIKEDELKRVDEDVIDRSSDVITKITDTYSEITIEEGDDVAGEYIFNVMASYIMLSIQLMDMNKYLIEKLGEEDEYL